LLILGTHTFAVEIADLVSDIPDWRLVGFVENWERERCRQPLEGLPVHWVDDVAPLAADHHAVCGLGTTQRVGFIEQVAAHGMPFATLVHPTARVSRKSVLGAGAILSVGVIVAAHTRLGRYVLVNRGALIGHHATIGDYVTLGPGANVAGSCEIGAGTYVGMGAIILDHVRVGAHSVIGAGAVVTNDVASNVQVVGVPARVVKDNISGK
jgi:sugar O-acyltransferase (sialic acid O-acetyltransferase NeuD family)